MTQFFFSHCERTLEANTSEEALDKLNQDSKNEDGEVESNQDMPQPESSSKKKAKGTSSKK